MIIQSVSENEERTTKVRSERGKRGAKRRLMNSALRCLNPPPPKHFANNKTSQPQVLFADFPGFNSFMVTLANNLLRDSLYGMFFRVVLGAVLSTTDALTDIYVIATYYSSSELTAQANMLLAMVFM